MRFAIAIALLLSTVCQAADGEMFPAPRALNYSAPRSGLSLLQAAPTLLPPQRAFMLSVTVADAYTLHAEFAPAPDYYLYRDRIRFELADGRVARIKEVVLPPAGTKTDPNLGTLEVYPYPFRGLIKLERVNVAQQHITLHAFYQGCSGHGVCYAPISKSVELELPTAKQPRVP